MATHSGPSEENDGDGDDDDDDGSLTLHSVVTPSSLVIRKRALKTFLYPLRWSAGNLETQTVRKTPASHFVSMPSRESCSKVNRVSPSIGRHPDQRHLCWRPHKCSNGSSCHTNQSL